MDFYPSISKELLTKSINYAKSITTIEEEVIATVFHARKSFLFDKTNVWVKKDNSDFYVTMGSYDGAEVCELVGLYLLNLLTNEFGKNHKHILPTISFQPYPSNHIISACVNIGFT